MLSSSTQKKCIQDELFWFYFIVDKYLTFRNISDTQVYSHITLKRNIFFLGAEQSVNAVFTQLICQYKTSLLYRELQNIDSSDLFIE